MRSGVRKKWDDLNFKAESFYRKYEYRKKAFKANEWRMQMHERV